MPRMTSKGRVRRTVSDVFGLPAGTNLKGERISGGSGSGVTQTRESIGGKTHSIQVFAERRIADERREQARVREAHNRAVIDHALSQATDDQRKRGVASQQAQFKTKKMPVSVKAYATTVATKNIKGRSVPIISWRVQTKDGGDRRLDFNNPEHIVAYRDALAQESRISTEEDAPPEWNWLNPFERVHWETERTGSKYDQAKGFDKVKYGAARLGLGAAGTTVVPIYHMIRHPVKTGKAVAELGKNYKEIPSKIKSGGEKVGKMARAGDPYLLGAGAGLYGQFKLPGYATKGADYIRTIGKSPVPESAVWSKQVLKGQSTFPKASSTTDILKKFKNTADFPSQGFMTSGISYDKMYRPFSGIGGDYAPGIGTIRYNVLNPMTLKGVFPKKRILAHEYTHKLDPHINPSGYKVISNKGSSSLRPIYNLDPLRSGQVRKDIKLLGAEKYFKSFLNQYPRAERGTEAFAEFAATFPNEVVMPTTLTGKRLNTLWGQRASPVMWGSHATKARIPKSTKVGGNKRIEDQGLYMSSWGEGSPYFLRSSVVDAPGLKFSLNPFKGVLDSPKVLKVGFTDIVRHDPKIRAEFNKIYKAKGYNAANKFINEWYKKNAKKGTAYVPMRSEPIIGNPELQAIIPKGMPIKHYRTKHYTTYKGRRVKIPEYTTLVDDLDIPLQSKSRLKFKKDLKKGLDDYYYPDEYVTPYEYLPYRLSYAPKYSKPYYPYARGVSVPNYQGFPVLPYSGVGSYSNNDEVVGDYVDGHGDTPPPNYYYDGGTSGGDTPPPGYFIGPTPVSKVANTKPLKKTKSLKQKQAYQPVLKFGNKKMEGNYYETNKGAISEGMELTDDYSNHDFTIVKKRVPEYMIRKARSTKVGYKFTGNKGLYTEKRKYRKDRSREKDFGWMKLMGGSVRSAY